MAKHEPEATWICGRCGAENLFRLTDSECWACGWVHGETLNKVPPDLNIDFDKIKKN